MEFSSVFVISESAELLSELCAGARTLFPHVSAVCFGEEAVSCGADRLIVCPLDDGVSPEDYAAVIADEIKANGSALAIVANTIRGRCLAALLGVALDVAAFSGVSELIREDGALVCRRMVYGGTAQRRDAFTKPYAVVTIGSGVFDAPACNAPAAKIERIAGKPTISMRLVERREKRESAVNLAAAKRIVDVGRGLAAEEDLALCRALASALGAEVGCSRPVAENNKWLPKSSYLGITGTQVKPELILTLGVSGQVQHIGGINKSRVIVAVNKDKAAPIFKNADFGLVGDLYKIVPALIEALS